MPRYARYVVSLITLASLACGEPATAPDPVSISAATTSLIVAPSNLTAKASSSTAIALAWTDNSSNETGFEVWRSTTGPTGTFSRRTTRGANSTSWTDTGLADNAQYCYMVRAVGGSGTTPSDYSNTACATTPIKKPSNLVALITDATVISPSWNDNSAGETGYEVWRATSLSGTYSLKVTLPANSTRWNDAGRTPGKQYCYKVRAIASGVTSSYSNKSCATAPSGLLVRVVLFGDSNTDRCEELDPSTRRSSYVSTKTRLAPQDPPQSCSVAAKVTGGWSALRTEPIWVVNHAIASTTTGGGLGGGPDRTSQGAPNARTSVNGFTRFEGEAVAAGYPWSGGEPVNTAFSGPILRVNAYVPGAHDFVYVSMGTNDDAGPTRTLTAQQTADNLRWMIGRWTAAGGAADHFILTTLAPRDDANSPTSIPDRNTLIRALAAELGVHLIDLSAYVSDDNGATWRDPSLNIGDGIHYTEAVRTWLGGQVGAWLSQESP